MSPRTKKTKFITINLEGKGIKILLTEHYTVWTKPNSESKLNMNQLFINQII